MTEQLLWCSVCGSHQHALPGQDGQGGSRCGLTLRGSAPCQGVLENRYEQTLRRGNYEVSDELGVFAGYEPPRLPEAMPVLQDEYGTVVAIAYHAPGDIELRQIRAAVEGAGYGTIMMQRLCRWATMHECYITLSAIPRDGERRAGWLMGWYSSFGFKSVAPGSYKMIRRPNDTKLLLYDTDALANGSAEAGTRLSPFRRITAWWRDRASRR